MSTRTLGVTPLWWRTAAAALVPACLGLAACTADAPDPSSSAKVAASVTTAGSEPLEQESAAGPSGVPVRGVSPAAPVAPVTQPDPGMTAIEEAARCTIRRPLDGAVGAVPGDAVFPGAAAGLISEPFEVIQGPDGGDPVRCPGELPPEPYCTEALPWTGLGFGAFVTASGAERAVDGFLLTMPPQADKAAPPESIPGTRVVSYRLVDLPPGDPRGLGDYLDRSFRTCAKARDGVRAGAVALVGTVPSEYGASSAEVVLMRRGTHLLWATFDGGGWRKGEQQRAAAVLVSRLL
jgi:hypothetical protein